MSLRRALVGLIVGLVLVVIAGGLRPPTTVDAQHIGPGGAMALGPGPKEVHGFVRVVDADTLDVNILDAQGIRKITEPVSALFYSDNEW